MDAELLRALCASAATSSIALLIVLALRGAVRRRFGARLAYALWSIVPCAAAAVLLPAPRIVATPTVAPAVVQWVGAAVAAVPAPADRRGGLLAVWLAGAAATACVFVRQQRRYRRGLGALARRRDGHWQAQTEACGPALLGSFRPRIVLPRDFERRYTRLERGLIVAHETTHRRRGDAQINLIVATLRCLYWFNPLVHLAAARLRADQEFACDAAVISAHPRTRSAYATAMLKTQLAQALLPLGCQWQSTHLLKERIVMLQQPLPGPARRALGVAVALVCALGSGYAAWASQPNAPALAKTSAAPELAGVLPDPGVPSVDVAIDLRVQNGATHSVRVRSPEGQSFGVADGEREPRWHIDGIAQPQDSGHYVLQLRVQHGDRVIGEPVLRVENGGRGDIAVTDDATGAHLDAGFVPTRVGAAPVVAGDQDASEDITYRRMLPPQYPPAAIAARQQGHLMLKVRIDRNGDPIDAAVDSAEPAEARFAFGDASVSAAMRWKYNPRIEHGAAVPGEVMVPIDFAIHD
jgi:TonB family protein